MVRPQKDRFIAFKPNTSYFKPRGIPMLDLDEVRLTVDEREAIRLSDLLGLSHEEAGQSMGVSRATFGRIIQRARKAVADAIINGKAINIEGGNFKMVDAARFFRCRHCSHHWEELRGTGRPQSCPQCGCAELHRVAGNGDVPTPPI
ncbi:MAG: DUF134 domain-containing protein [Desulfobacterales bacterium]|jgi:uncharacterized protein